MPCVGGVFYAYAHGEGDPATANGPLRTLWVMVCMTGWRTPHRSTDHVALSDDGPKLVEVVAPEAIKINPLQGGRIVSWLLQRVT